MVYLIAAKADDETEEKFYSTGEWAGEWVGIKQATEFKTEDEALERLRGSEFTKPSTMSDGTIYPPRMIHDGANINNLKPKGSLAIRIVRPEIVLHKCSETVIYEGEIDRHTKEQRIAAVREILKANDISDADLDMIRQNR